MFDSTVISSLISAVSSVLVVVLTVKLRQVKKRNPLDETADYYLKLIRQQEKSMDRLYRQLDESERIIKLLRNQLRDVQTRNQALEKQLAAFKRDYGNV